MTAAEIQNIRKKLGLTQNEFAEKLGCRRATISDWEAGKKTIGNAYTKLLQNMLKQK